MDTLEQTPQKTRNIPYWWFDQESDHYDEMDFSGNSEDPGETQYFYQEEQT